MSTDPAARVRDYIADLKVPPPPPASQFIRGPRRASRTWLVPIAAALAVCAVLFVAAIRSGGGDGAPIAGGDRRPSLPDKFAPYSYLTGAVSQSPPGPAIVVYQQGWGVELADFPQGLVLGAYDDIYRRVDLADDREDSQDQGDPAPMLLSPDGDRLAVGSHRGLGNLALLDLTTGRTATVAAAAGKAVRPLAWSRDGRYIAAIELNSSEFNQTLAGSLVLFDLTAGTAARWEQYRAISMATFSPDSKELAVQGSGIFVIDLQGRTLRTLTPPGQPYLTTESAWSPDGTLIATVSNADGPKAGNTSYSVVFLDATGQGRPVPAPITGVFNDSAIGWTATDRLLTRLGSPGALSPHNLFVEVGVWSGQRRKMSEFDSSPDDNYALARIQFASNLLLDIQNRPAGDPNRGPWPVWLQAIAAVAVLGIGLISTLIIRWRRRRGATRGC